MERRVDSRGYVKVKVDGVWVSEHRYVVEQHLGRKLVKGKEVVHHKDHNPSNNAIKNLEVLSPSQHSSLHGVSKRRFCFTCGEQFRPYEYKHDECSAFDTPPLGSARDLFA